MLFLPRLLQALAGVDEAQTALLLGARVFAAAIDYHGAGLSAVETSRRDAGFLGLSRQRLGSAAQCGVEVHSVLQFERP